MKRASVSKKPGAGTPVKGYEFELYIAGTGPRSCSAARNIKRICEEFLPGRHKLLIVDIYQNPALAKKEEIVAVPTLIKKHPLPPKRFVGDLSNSEKMLTGLGLAEPAEAA